MRTQRNIYGDSIVRGDEQMTNKDEEKDKEMETEVDNVSLEQQELQLEQREEQLAIKRDMQQEEVTSRKEKKLNLQRRRKTNVRN